MKATFSKVGFFYDFHSMKVAPKYYDLAAILVSDGYGAKEAKLMAVRLMNAWTLYYNMEGDAVDTLYKLGSPWPVESRFFRSDAGSAEAMAEMERKLKRMGCVEVAWEDLKESNLEEANE